MTPAKKVDIASKPTADPRKVNPIIGRNAQETMDTAAAAMSFLARMHSDLADWQFIANNSEECGPELLLSNEQRGLSVLCECIASALMFEVEGRS